MTLDMSAAWSDGLAKVKANFQLLAIVGGVFFLLPAIVMGFVLPDAMAAVSQPSFDPDAAEKLLASLGPSFFGMYAIAIVATFIGYVAMMALMSDRSRPTVGEAIGRGLKAFPTMMAVLIAFMLAYILLALAVGLVAGGLGLISSTLAGIAVFIGIVGVLVGVALIATRMSMSMPVIALEDTLNPVTVLKRSWTMTKPVQWPLLGFFVLLTVGYMVIAIVLSLVVGLAIAAIGSPVLSGIFNGVIGTIVAMIFTGVVAAVYDQLNGGSAASLSDTFE